MFKIWKREKNDKVIMDRQRKLRKVVIQKELEIKRTDDFGSLTNRLTDQKSHIIDAHKFIGSWQKWISIYLKRCWEGHIALIDVSEGHSE